MKPKILLLAIFLAGFVVAKANNTGDPGADLDGWAAVRDPPVHGVEDGELQLRSR